MTQLEEPSLKKHKPTRTRSPIHTFVSVPRHPLGVKPSGNNLLLERLPSSTKIGDLLGTLKVFDDELLLLLISYITSPRDLLSLSHCSRVLYTYCYHDDLWKSVYFANNIKVDKWLGSWRKTIMKIDKEALIQLNDTVYSDLLYRPYQCSYVDYKQIFKKLILQEQEVSDIGEGGEVVGHIRRIPEDKMNLTDFNDNWIDKPFILTNQKNQERWPLHLTLEYLSQNYSDEIMRQEAVKWSIRFYLEYFRQNKDENPLYLFDPTNRILQDLNFKLPKPFEQDLFKIFEHCRPDHKWIIIGPSRSGSTFHKDPNTTSAWNTTLQGKKIWIMTPPHITPPGVSTDKTEEEVTSPIGLLEWVLSGFYNDSFRLSQTGDCLIGVTFPGECLYVPSGWWHTVINVDDTIALTQNFMPLKKLDKVLNFFQNRNEQISGFHPNEVYVEMENLIAKLQEREEIEYFRNKLDQLKNLKDEAEDVGELGDVELPIFELFTMLLKLNGYGEELSKSLERLQIKPTESWNAITIQKSSFTFNFDEED